MDLEQHPHPAVNICPSCWCCRDGGITRGAVCKFGTGQDSCCPLPVPSRGLRQHSPVPGVHRPPSAGMRDCKGVLSSEILWNRDYQCQRCVAILLESLAIPASLEEAVHPWHGCWAGCSCLTYSFCQGWKGDRLGRVKSLNWWYRLDGMEMAWCEQNRIKQYSFRADSCFTTLFPGLLILRPTHLPWQKDRERLTVELTTPHTTSTVSAPERHKQQNLLFSRKSAGVDSCRSGGNKGISVPLDCRLQLSAFVALSLSKKEDLTQREVWKERVIINREVLFKYHDYMTIKLLICCSEKRKKWKTPWF